MSLADLALHLENEGLGTRGKDIFVDTSPASVSSSILLRKRPGRGWIADFQGDPRWLDFQVVVRSPSYAAGDANALAVARALIVRQKTIGASYFYRVDPEHEPWPAGREDSGEETFVINCTAYIRTL